MKLDSEREAKKLMSERLDEARSSHADVIKENIDLKQTAKKAKQQATAEQRKVTRLEGELKSERVKTEKLCTTALLAGDIAVPPVSCSSRAPSMSTMNWLEPVKLTTAFPLTTMADALPAG